MKYIITNLFAMMVFSATAQKLDDTTFLQPVELIAIRASDGSPVAKTNLSGKEIKKENLGQDLPFILNQTPSLVVNSDAGNGIGYTGFRIRGTDATRINVTMNGIPYNDAESQGSFFVDLPDIASSANSIQIQRGVGTSTNGAGSFGGTINISTNDIIQKRNIEINNSFGSYHSFKNSLIYNSGIFAKHFLFDARLSNIRSDGYIERATTRLKSFYTSAAYINKHKSLRLNIFSGKEKTYQAWNGVDEKTLMTNRRYNSAGREKEGEPYENETDNYTQTHYQLFYNHKLNTAWKGNIALFLTKGTGYYEQYKAAEQLSSYGLPDYIADTAVIAETNLVRRLWLDNDFYGSVFSLQYNRFATNLIIGGSWNRYEGKHFGEIIRADVQAAIPSNYKWYNLNADKNDFSVYTKWTEQVSKNWQSFADIQVRSVQYDIGGFRNNPGLKTNNTYFFINPKVGITYTQNKTRMYFSFGHTSKEPNRDDFEAGSVEIPKAESLNDFELGLERKNKKSIWGINLYYMLYKDQLVLTGQINDVGAYTRRNIKNSSRAGVELHGNNILNKWLSVSWNFTLSENKIKGFTEFIDDYDNGGQQTKYYGKTNLPFSPAVISNFSLNIIPFKNGELRIISKYISRQFLDNTAQKSKSLNPYFVQDLRASYELTNIKLNAINFFVQANNILSEKYEANGYTFSYIYENKKTTENYYFPMAPINVMVGINVSIR